MSYGSACTNYCYAARGNSCSSVSSALTSNRKFIPPANSVYNELFSRMLQYPGHSGDFITNVQESPFPEQIKAYRNRSLDHIGKVHWGHEGVPVKVSNKKSCCGN